MKDRDAPLDCWTCKHRKPVEVSACVGAALYRQTCMKFRYDLLGDARPMGCIEAYDEFCGGGCYKPDFWTKVVNIFNRLTQP